MFHSRCALRMCLTWTCVVGVKDGSVELITAEGDTLSQPNTCCRYIATLGPFGKQLLGSSPEEEALISEWLSKRHTLLTHITEKELAEVLPSTPSLCNVPF